MLSRLPAADAGSLTEAREGDDRTHPVAAQLLEVRERPEESGVQHGKLPD